MVAKVKKSPKIEKFLEVYSSKSTKVNYRAALTKFFECVGISPDDYFREKRDYEADIKKFFISIKNSAPKTIKLNLSAVKMFLMENNIELPQKFWNGLRRKIKGSRAMTQDKVPSNEELKSILTHTDAKGRALYLVLSSSGMRIGEALKITLDDINLEVNPARIHISGEYTKTGNPRIAFISTEAKEAITEWLKVRDRYIKAARGKAWKYGKNENDNRLFPFEYSTALRIWENMIKKSGYAHKDNNTRRFKVHPHVLRKYFRSRMGTIIPVDIVEALMGHEGYLTEVYRKYSEEQLAEFYLKGEQTLTVFNDRNGVKKLRNEVNAKMETYDEIINRQAAEIKTLRERLAEMEQSKDKQLVEAFIQALENNPDIAKELTELLIKKVLEKHPEMMKRVTE